MIGYIIEVFNIHLAPPNFPGHYICPGSTELLCLKKKGGDRKLHFKAIWNPIKILSFSGWTIEALMMDASTMITELVCEWFKTRTQNSGFLTPVKLPLHQV